MKLKILLLNLFIMAFASGTYAMAQPALGGIHLHDNMKYVKQIYGEPNSVSDVFLTEGIIFYYYGKDDSVRIAVTTPKMGGNNNIDTVYLTANNGFNTPEGIRVGSSLKDVVNAYGNELDIIYGPAKTPNADKQWKKVAKLMKNRPGFNKLVDKNARYDFLLALASGEVPGFILGSIIVKGADQQGYIIHFTPEHEVKDILLYDFGQYIKKQG